MRMSVLQILTDPVAAGTIRGKKLFADLILAMPKGPKEPGPLFLDFAGVEVATASFLRESIFALKDYLRNTNSLLYIVLANPNPEIWDELSVIAHAKGDAILTCNLGPDGAYSSPEIIGALDQKQQMTYDLVVAFEEVDASTLMERYGESEGTKSTTAWNNRLASLASKGIIREFTRGRSKFYRPLL
jgi:hypothetical protein